MLRNDLRATDLLHWHLACYKLDYYGRPAKQMQTLYLWSPYEIRQTIIFLPCGFYLLFSSPNLSGRRLDVYHTSTHGVALVRI